MSRRLLICGLMLLAIPTCFAEDKPETKPTPPKNANLDKLTKLAGTWVKADDNGKPTDEVVSIIKSTAGGSAVTETLFPGTDMEMVSVYTVDGPDLVMTHYCVIGNQPKLKADPKSASNKIEWVFVGGSNLDVKKDRHMHGGSLTIVDKDHIEFNGIGWVDGKPAEEMCGVMKLTRKK